MNQKAEQESNEEKPAPKYFKIKKNGVKFFAIVSILSSIVMFASGICYLSKSEEEKDIKVLIKLKFINFCSNFFYNFQADGKIIIFSYLTADMLIHLIGLYGAFKEQMECIKVYGVLITVYIIFTIVRLGCGADLAWQALIWNSGGLLLTIAFYRDLVTIENQYDYSQV